TIPATAARATAPRTVRRIHMIFSLPFSKGLTDETDPRRPPARCGRRLGKRRETVWLHNAVAATDPLERFGVGAACRIDVPAHSRQIASIAVGLDPEGVGVDVASSRSDWVTVVDLQALEPIAWVPVGKEPIDLVFDAATDRIFTADAHSDSVSVVDGETLRLTATIPVGGYPSGLAYDADARRLYCGNSLGGTMSVIDVDSLETVATVEAEIGAGAIELDRTRRLI